ncbi:MAG: substrate-binding domain-containing protein [Muribaculaceae bacterium]|nr:substrate-binding domain-containing protein [Muribaculaceae bacterium]
MVHRTYYLILFLLAALLGGCREKHVYKIGISQCSSDDWREKMNQEIELEASLHEDILVEIRSANDDSQKQINDLEYFAKNGFDVIVVAPNEADAITPEIQKLHRNGIPVVIFDRNISDSSYTQRIGVDNIGLGRNAAEYALAFFPDSIKSLEISGLPGSTPALERSKGFNEVFSSVARAKILGRTSGNWQQQMAQEVADSLLRIFPETNLIFAHNDRMAIGARKAVENLNREDIKIIGIDAAPKIGMAAVNEEKLLATFLYPTEGDIILNEAIKIAKGEPFQTEILLPTTSAVDKTNIDILLLQNKNLEENTEKILTLKDRLDNYVSLHNAQTALVYAIIAILVLLFGVLFLVLRTFWAHRRHQAALLSQNYLLQEERDKQKELNDKLEKATQSKLVFFTNVSHDLRTPLTLIAEPVAQLNEAKNLDNQQKTLIKIADKNVKILQRLINQILDFRKFENDRLELSLTEVDFNKAIEGWMESFYAVAKKRDIRLALESPDYDVVLALDPEKIESVFFNLISNALKYSPDNSSITVKYFIEEGNLVIKVADTGEGISREDIANIFDRFFQVDRVRPRGSGIGLSLAKAFVELHGGSISVESELKKGSTFTVVIPIRHVAEKAEEISRTITREDVEAELDNVETEKTFSEDKPLLLIIDDNKDIRELVAQLMNDDYNVISAPNGKEGIRKAEKYVPDIIVCDVMMPGMDGMECCSKLKSEPLTSHIPVMMLTACSQDEQRVQGLDSGADAYMSKPFSSAVMKAQVKSLIANRKRIKDLFAEGKKTSPEGQTSSAAISQKGASGQAAPSNALTPGDIDNDFYNRFLSIFEKKMADPNLSVETIASEMGFERTQLYRKIKAITNYSPVELMRRLRLQKARNLLKSSEKSISEICYEVGFSTPAYFSKCYRDQFGETPSETRSSLH